MLSHGALFLGRFPGANPRTGALSVLRYAIDRSSSSKSRVSSKEGVERWVPWNSLVLKYLEQGRSDEAVAMIEEMCLEEEDSVPGESLIVAALNRLVSSRMLDAGRRIHRVAAGLNLFGKRGKVGRALLEMYARCGSVREAGEIFDSMPEERTGEWWGLMIRAYTKRGWIKEAVILFERSLLEGIDPSEDSLAAALSCCSRSPAAAGMIQAIVEEAGLTEKLAAPLVRVYAKAGRFGEAWKVMGKIESAELGIWSGIVLILARVDGIDRVLKEMDLDLEDGRVLSYLLRACEDREARQLGRTLHDLALDAGLESDAGVGSGLVEMYASWGEIEQAREVFFRMESRDDSLWKFLLDACSIHRQERLTEKLYREMLLEGIKPSEIGINSLVDSTGIFRGFDNAMDQSSRLRIELARTRGSVDETETPSTLKFGIFGSEGGDRYTWQ